MSTEIKEIGPFRILGELGQGGMGKVYKALQPSVNRIVALKVLPEVLEKDETAVRRFAQEAETAANLTHPNIVKVWDASVHQPPYYIAMEFLEGRTLADRLASGPLPLHEAVEIMQCVCSALDHAHERGVIHRDIKPTNIMFDGKGKPVVTDFGIARTSDHTRLTASGSIFGTPDFMSPEQAKGQKIDYRSDLYSAAVVFYETLTGRPPFVNDNPLVTMNQIINDPVPPPSSFGTSIPPAVETVLAYALAKNPDERYQGGAELAQALQTALTPRGDGSNAQESLVPTGPAVPQAVSRAPLADAFPVEAVPIPDLWRRRKAILASFLAIAVIGIVGLLIHHGLAVSGNHGGTVGTPTGTTAPPGLAVSGNHGGTVGTPTGTTAPPGLAVSGSDGGNRVNPPPVDKGSARPGNDVGPGGRTSAVIPVTTTSPPSPSTGPHPPPPPPPPPRVYTCRICGAGFGSQAALNIHMRVHAPPPPPPPKTFRCPLCGKVFLTKGERDTHEAIEVGGGIVGHVFGKRR
jgi:hypothetical protein